VSFYITRGRVREARARYGAALDQLLPIEDEIDPWLYQHFHRWIARLLVHRARLDFAREVLEAIPPRLRKDIPWVPELFRRLAALEEADKHGAVFPAHLPPDTWWNGPHLFRRREPGKGELTGWWPGRVADIDHDDRILHLWTGIPRDAEHDEPRYGWLDLSFADFEKWSEDDTLETIQVDRFFEMAAFKGSEAGEITVIRTHEVRLPEELPRIFPPPDRYLKRWGQS
jgi:hypothetical protein